LEVIRTIKSKDFSFSFTEDISKFVILRKDIGRDIGRVRDFCQLY